MQRSRFLLPLALVLAACFACLGDEPAAPVRKHPDPTPAIVALRVPSGAGSATLIGPRRADGRWDVLTAAHCVADDRACNLLLRDGRQFTATVATVAHRFGIREGRLVVVDATAPDVAWCILDDATAADLPCAVLAAVDPEPGTAVWHRGFGFGRHGILRFDGTVRPADGHAGLLPLVIDFEGGDSGGGVFRVDSNELVGVASNTAGRGKKVNAWVGPVSLARKLRPGVLPPPMPPLP